MASVIPVQCSTCTAPADYLLLLSSLLLLPRAIIYNSFCLSVFNMLLLLLLSFL